MNECVVLTGTLVRLYIDLKTGLVLNMGYPVRMGGTSNVRDLPLEIWPRGYKKFFMLNSAELKISDAQNY